LTFDLIFGEITKIMERALIPVDNLGLKRLTDKTSLIFKLLEKSAGQIS